jgi:hypothetical protein
MTYAPPRYVTEMTYRPHPQQLPKHGGTMNTRQIPPAVAAALETAQAAGESARRALAALAPNSTATPIGTECLPFPGDATADDLMTAAYALSARLTDGPRDAAGWDDVADLAQWIEQAANAHRQELDGPREGDNPAPHRTALMDRKKSGEVPAPPIPR